MVALNLTGNLFRYQLNGDVDGERFPRFQPPGGPISTVLSSWNGIPDSVDRGLQRAVQNAPGERGGFFVANVALRKEFLKKQMSVAVNARDMFATGVNSFTSGRNFLYLQ